jgi:cadmium resistance protein CadD (predicted permease)
MNGLLTAIPTGISAFAATNLDDLVILTLFFSQVNATFRRRHIAIGQYLGFTALLIASLPGFFGGMVLSKMWIGFLGLLPLMIGIRHLLNRHCDHEDPTVQAISPNLTRAAISRSPIAKFTSLLHPQTLNVAAVTFANGGDNIGIYLPLFVSNSLASLTITLVTSTQNGI